MKRIFIATCALFGAIGISAQNPYISLQGASEKCREGTDRFASANDFGRRCGSRMRPDSGRPVRSLCAKISGSARPADRQDGLDAERCPHIAGRYRNGAFAGALKAPEKQIYKYTEAEDEFPRVLIDKTGIKVSTLEEAASEAVNTIYSLRRHRMELITGDAGENVFGEGLKAALDEIDRLEQSYLELFLGKRIVTTSSHRYVVYPQTDKQQYVVCRFSAADGLLPDNDLSGDMVLLQINPTEPQRPTSPPANANRRSYRVVLRHLRSVG